MALVRMMRHEAKGYPPVHIAPGCETTVRWHDEHDWIVRRLNFSPSASDLLIRSLDVGGKRILENVPCSTYVHPELATDGELLDRIHACFRYQDHTLEEYKKVIRIMRVEWEHASRTPNITGPVLRGGQIVELRVFNPTAAPVLLMTRLDCQVRFE